MNKLVSVIMPFYKGKTWLKEAIDSVLGQTYHPIELILVNDGSNEDISDIISEYNGRIRYFQKENGGAATARNLGIEVAKGEYIAFMDSDDIWFPEKTEKQIAFMEERGVKWSHTGFYFWWPEFDKLQLVRNCWNYGNVHEQCKINFAISTPSVVIHRTVFETYPNLRFPVDFRYGQDSAFYRVISKYYPLGLIEEPLMKVRMRGKNTGRRALVRLQVAYLFNEKRKKNVDGYDVKDPFVRMLFRYNALGYKFFSRLHISDELKEKLAKVYWYPELTLEWLYARKFKTDKHKNQIYIKRQEY